jgi:hypothetical protein
LGIELDISTQDACAFWRDHTVYKSVPLYEIVLISQEPWRCPQQG